jgi:hypothetical protein
MPSARGGGVETEIRRPLEIPGETAIWRVTKLRKVQYKPRAHEAKLVLGAIPNRALKN